MVGRNAEIANKYMEVEIEVLQADNIQEFKQLLTVFDIVFEYEPYTRPDDVHLINLLKKSSFYAIIATADDRIIAGLTAYTLDQYHLTQPILYIQDLAVLTEYQRKGVGKKLIEFVIKYCIENDFQQMFIQAEKIDDYAVEFYRSTEPSGEMEVVYFFYETQKND